MDPLDRSVIKIGSVALVICAAGVLGVDSPVLRKGPPPVHVALRRPPPCVPGAAVPLAAPRAGEPDRIVPVAGPCAPRPSQQDAASALRRLRDDLQRIQVLKEKAAGQRPR